MSSIGGLWAIAPIQLIQPISNRMKAAESGYGGHRRSRSIQASLSGPRALDVALYVAHIDFSPWPRIRAWQRRSGVKSTGGGPCSIGSLLNSLKPQSPAKTGSWPTIAIKLETVPSTTPRSVLARSMPD